MKFDSIFPKNAIVNWNMFDAGFLLYSLDEHSIPDSGSFGSDCKLSVSMD